MKLAIMQPYFLPYPGYFSLVKHTDQFILFDTVQYIRHGWIERNRILKPDHGWQYIAVPLEKHSRETLIQDIRIRNSTDWRETIFSQLEHYKKRAPYYPQAMEVLRKALDIDTDSLVKLNEQILITVCQYLGIDIKIHIFSEMEIAIEPAGAPDEWALNICKAIGAVEEYWNPEGGLEFFDRSKYEREGIAIKFLKLRLPEYSQRRSEFEAGLSMCDLMMFCQPEQINKMLEDYVLL